MERAACASTWAGEVARLRFERQLMLGGLGEPVRRSRVRKWLSDCSILETLTTPKGERYM